MKMEFSAGGIIYQMKDRKYWFALILNSYGEWTFPKGHIEKKEKPEIAAMREVSEEVGLKDLKIISKLDKIDYWFKLEGELIHKFVYFYLMETPKDSELVAQEEEVQDARWFEPEEALKVLKYKEDIEILKNKAFETLKIALK